MPRESEPSCQRNCRPQHSQYDDQAKIEDSTFDFEWSNHRNYNGEGCRLNDPASAAMVWIKTIILTDALELDSKVVFCEGRSKMFQLFHVTTNLEVRVQ